MDSPIKGLLHLWLDFVAVHVLDDNAPIVAIAQFNTEGLVKSIITADVANDEVRNLNIVEFFKGFPEKVWGRCKMGPAIGLRSQRKSTNLSWH